MSLFQATFAVLFALQAGFALRRFGRGHHPGSLLFATVWTAAIVVVLNPSLSTTVAARMGIGRGVDLVTYALLSLFLWAHYQHYLRYRRLEQQVTALVRTLALATAEAPATVNEGAARPPRG